MGILTIGVVTKPFHFESGRRMRVAEAGVAELKQAVDTLIVIPNQNLFRVASERTTFVDAFAMADQILCSGVACITNLMVKEGLVNLDFADVCSIMYEMGAAMIGTGEATGEGRAVHAAETAIANPLLDETSMRGARGLLVSITGSRDLTLYELDEAAGRIRQEVDDEANIIVGATFDDALGDAVQVSVVATGIDRTANFHLAGMSAQPPLDPVLDSVAGAFASVQDARVDSSTVQGHPPLTDKEVEIQQPTNPVIPFPEPTERRRAVRRPPFLERLGFTRSEAHSAPRASGWR
jgi:cell division protein FtsZ